MRAAGDSLAPTPDDLRRMLCEIAAQWRRLADDGEARAKPSMSSLEVCSGRLGGQ